MPRRRGSTAAERHAAGQSLMRAQPQLPISDGKEPPASTGQGRGPGKANQRIAQLLAARGVPQPWEVLAHVMSRSTADLAVYLNCGVIEALRLQIGAAAELLPYTAKKLPLDINGALEITDQRDDAAIAEAIVAKFRSLRAETARTVENQPLIEGDAAQVGRIGVGRNERKD